VNFFVRVKKFPLAHTPQVVPTSFGRILPFGTLNFLVVVLSQDVFQASHSKLGFAPNRGLILLVIGLPIFATFAVHFQ
jgi:hypothetical protein